MIEVGQIREWIDEKHECEVKDIVGNQCLLMWQDGTNHYYDLETDETKTVLKGELICLNFSIITMKKLW